MTSSSSRVGSLTPCSAPFESAGYEIMITASVGVAYAGPGKRISTHLVSEADKAMYEAKRSRNGVESH